MQSKTVAAEKSSPGDNPCQNDTGRDSYYSDKFHYRVDYPKGARILVDNNCRDVDEGETFTSSDKKLKGEVSGEDNSSKTTAAEACATRAASVANITYKVVKPGWYAFSGTDGANIVYEKAFVGAAIKTLRLEYPVSESANLDPLVKRIIASFQEYEVFRGQVVDAVPGVVAIDWDGAAQRAICSYSEKEQPRFASVKKGDSITVAGRPEEVTDQDPSVPGPREHSIQDCVLH